MIASNNSVARSGGVNLPLVPLTATARARREARFAAKTMSKCKKVNQLGKRLRSTI
jgi:hypothetical protein